MFLIKPKKSLGQNFLIDKNIIKKIVNIGKISNQTQILEIGCGTGNMTSEILKCNPKMLFAIDKDKKLTTNLNNIFKFNKKLNIFNADILNFDEKSIIKDKVTVFGNLPYNISTQILAKWILTDIWPPWYNLLILMFQKEVAQRIIAKKKSKDFGRLSVLSNWRLRIKKHFDVSKNCFFPRPKVDSTVLSFVPVERKKYTLNNPKSLEKITRVFFSNKRKMVNKAYKKVFNNRINPKIKINLKLRPGELDCSIFYKLAKYYEEIN